ncbi:MAG: hypothetical protein QOF53_560 [Nocardioidaceae bacterium]|nr:hypothetical protein [Nocardioidaceae bacterium]
MLSDEALRDLSEVAKGFVGDDRVPGLVALVAHCGQVHVETQGVATVGGEAVRRDTVFRIASTTKPVTAAAALVLAAEGLFDLDEPVDRLLPELAELQVLRRPDGPLTDTVPAARPVTARQLLTFTFGFGMDMAMFATPTPWPVVTATFERGALTIGPPNPAATPEPDSWIAALGSLPLIAQPGERWLYNTGTQVLGVLAARAAGTSYDEVLRTRIFDPLGMTDTGFCADPGRLPTAYQTAPDGLAVWDPPDGMWSSPPAFPDGSAGLVSTADDLLAFARMLLADGTPVLPAESVAAMTRDQLTRDQKQHGGFGPQMFADGGWGYGVFVHTGGERAGAYGWDGGLGTSWLVDPVRDLVVIVLTQRLFDTHLPPPVHTALQDAAYAALR